jgi:FlaA1/EpsC-like NDP-sugar epimerase
MGVSKRICELILKTADASGTKCMAVRFGNVVV